jgi:tetratricopeptide (TPR) repeat protein
MFSKIFNSIFLIPTIISFLVSVDAYIAQAKDRPTRSTSCKVCKIFITTQGGKTPAPIIPADILELSAAAVREGRATDKDYLVLGHNAINSQQYAEAEKYYSQANELAAETQDKEVLATSQFWLGEVNSTLGNQDRANSYFNQSISIFNTLGDSQSVNQVQLRQNQLRQQQLQLRPEVLERIELQQQRLNGR